MAQLRGSRDSGVAEELLREQARELTALKVRLGNPSMAAVQRRAEELFADESPVLSNATQHALLHGKFTGCDKLLLFVRTLLSWNGDGVPLANGAPELDSWHERWEAIAGARGGADDRSGGEPDGHLAEVLRRVESFAPYVGQSVVRWHRGRAADRSTRTAAEAVFAAGPLVVLLGDPGGGKTELLRRHELAVCRRWEAGDRSAALPVRVAATSLAEDPLENRFFASRPRPGAQWLVLLDGLDEITDAQVRRQVLRDAVHWVRKRRSSHRLVVATRYLSDQEQRDLQDDAPPGAEPVCFELLRLDTGDVRELAAARLGPEQVDGLMGAIEEAGLADLVTLPMIGAILCRLYRDRPGRPLGSTRGDVYDDFLTHLMATTPRTDTLPEHHAGRREDTAGTGDTGAAALLGPAPAERVVALATLAPADLRALLTWVADRRRECGGTRPVLDILLEGPLTKPPGEVPLRWWREQLIACFRRSGVLEQRGEELEFAHRTYEEFLAACAACHSPERGAAELHRVLGGHRQRHWPWRPAPGYAPGGGWGRRMWSTSAFGGENMSYLGFLVDRLTGAADADLGELPSSAGISGCTFLAALKRLGTYLPDEVQAQAVEKLRRHLVVDRRTERWASIDLEALNRMDPNSVPFAELLVGRAMDDSRVDAARALLAFPESRAEGLAALGALARTPRLTSVPGRVEAAIALVRAEDESGLALLEELASTSWLGDEERLGIAWQLAELHRERGLGLLDRWIDARTGKELWFLAALMVLAIDPPGGLARMRAIADDRACPPGKRLNAAFVAARHDDPRGAEDLLRFARDPGLDDGERVAAVHLLAHIGHPSAGAVREELVRDPGLSARSRRSLRT
ncbi:NACHT domain-containing protein [Streptomyces sp. NRRL WC-3742]|uniref:NACHT domain-containing protein n=1 Tax=Streptomyces sp. NRRL WC-3742 TaxID=1463934 RepID=UPI0004CA460D|nr:hypothetical protein [Streptomyces sp. NRRL WC-3742]